MPYIASSRASAGLLGGGSPRVLDVTWVRDSEPVGGSLRPVVSVLSPRLAGEVEYESSSNHGETHRASRSPARDERARSVEVTESLLRASERVMARVEALEAAKARVEADLMAAYGALHTIAEKQVQALPAGPRVGPRRWSCRCGSSRRRSRWRPGSAPVRWGGG
ncbi:hypothetical protein GCM10027039_33370 [Terrabacter koreensis]